MKGVKGRSAVLMELDPSSRKTNITAPVMLAAAAAAGATFALLNVGGSSLTAEKVLYKIASPLGQLLCYLAAGLLVGQVIESLGWTAKLAAWVRPLIRWGRLSDESGAVFVTAFVSGILANTMLMNAHEAGRLTRKQLVLTYLINNGLPMYFVHFPTTLFIVMSLAGKAGLVYLAITFLAACIRSVAPLVYSRISDPVPDNIGAREPIHRSEPAVGPLSGLWAKFRGRFFRLLGYTIPIYVLVFLANDWGLFILLRRMAAHWISGEIFPIEAAGLVVFSFTAEFSSGMAAAGALLDAGTLTVKQSVLALVVGAVISTPVRAVRHQLPALAGIFNLGLAGELLLLGQGFRILTVILVSIAYLLWW